MTGRHAKRTRVTPLDGDVGLGLGRWRVELATFDQPTNPQVLVGLRGALDFAHAFERSKAQARWIEQRQARPLATPSPIEFVQHDIADVVGLISRRAREVGESLRYRGV